MWRWLNVFKAKQQFYTPIIHLFMSETILKNLILSVLKQTGL